MGLEISGKPTNPDSLASAKAYLTWRLPSLYGPGRFHLELEKCTRSFDAMLKRGMLYARFGLGKVRAEAFLAPYRSGLLFSVSVPSGGMPFLDFLRKDHLNWLSGKDAVPVSIFGRTALLKIEGVSPDREWLSLSPSAPISKRMSASFVPLEEKSSSVWLGNLFDAWCASQDWNSGMDRLRIWPMLRKDFFAWNPISQIDVDTSQESRPHAFRWLERTLAQSSSYAPLEKTEIDGILLSAGVQPRPDSHLTGKTESEFSSNSACLALRYSHRVPDPTVGPDGGETGILSEPGFIVVEDDFHEIMIDAGTCTVIGETWKWRNPPVRKPEVKERPAGESASAAK
jgi:hypothetical protein